MRPVLEMAWAPVLVTVIVTAMCVAGFLAVAHFLGVL